MCLGTYEKILKNTDPCQGVGLRCLTGYSPQGRKELDMNEHIAQG